MKIAVICHQDCAKSGYQLYLALRSATEHDVNYAACYTHKREDYARAIDGADAIITACDALSYLDKGRFYLYTVYGKGLYEAGSGHPVKPGAVMISMPVGKKYLRKNTGWDHAWEVWPLSRYRESYDIVTPVEPDLNYPEINDGWLPHAIDTNAIALSWHRPKEFVVTAYLADRDSKQVNVYLVPAIKMLEKENISIKLVLSGTRYHVEHAVFMERKRNSTLYYGQITPLGVYGRSEVESMAMGVPVICGITDLAIERAADITDYGAPCLKALTVRRVAARLREVATGKIDLEAVSLASREYAVRVHSYEAVAKRALSIIEEAKRRRKNNVPIH